MILKGYVAIRKNSSEQLWIDTATFRTGQERTLAEIAKMRDQIPRWDATNPVQRIAQAVLKTDDRDDEPDWLNAALNEGDGSYKP